MWPGNNNHDNIYGAHHDQRHSESSSGSFLMNKQRVAANPETKPIDLGCDSVENWQLPSTSTVAIVIITQPVS